MEYVKLVAFQKGLSQFYSSGLNSLPIWPSALQSPVGKGICGTVLVPTLNQPAFVKQLPLMHTVPV